MLTWPKALKGGVWGGGSPPSEVGASPFKGTAAPVYSYYVIAALCGARCHQDASQPDGPQGGWRIYTEYKHIQVDEGPE